MRCKLSEKSMVKHKKGLWSPDEDQKLTNYVMNHGHLCWSSVPINAGLQRNGKSCRLRWINYLRPGLKRGAFSLQEEETILTLHALLGNKWSQISQHLPGRTDNEIKNYWHSHLKKRSVAKSQPLHDHQVHPELDLDHYTNSNMASMESSSSCLNTTCSFTNVSSADMANKQVPPVSQISNLPKILFADWISREEFQQDFGMSSGQPVISHGSNYQLTNTVPEYWQHNQESTEIENHKCLDSGSNTEIRRHTQMTIDQIFEFNDGDFNIDDFMYM